MDVKIFFLSFIPLFVAIDVLGLIPLFLSLTSEMDKGARNKLTTDASVTALIVSIIFLFGGKMIFNYLGITENDFRVGGGVVLLVIAVVELINPSEEHRAPSQTIGVVPIGIPLIMGPAALTTILIIVDQYGYFPAILALLTNIFIVWLVFRNATHLLNLLGEAGSKAVAKVAALFMAAIAIMMIRGGLSSMIKGF